MTCPVCGGKCRVNHCRGTCEEMYRKRVCVDCKHVFYTVEREEKEAKRDYLECAAEYDRAVKLKRVVKGAKK